MGPFVSRYLTRLDEEIAGARSDRDRDCLIAERTAYLARRGRMLEAKESLEALKVQYRASPVLEVNCWILFTDAMVQHYDDLKAGARDSFRRSQALGAAYGVSRLDALASAWLALIDYGRNDFASMDQWVRRALQLSPDDDHLVMSRACMVVAVAYQYSGQTELAAPWMERCRNHNSKLGDETTWSSTLHNFAWAKLIDLRQKRAHGMVTRDDVELTKRSIESAESFDHMARTQSLQVLNEVLVAQFRSLNEEHDAARRKFLQILPSARAHGLSQWIPILEADAAVSSLALGDLDAARQHSLSALAALTPTGHPDDVASSHSRLAEYFAAAGDVAAAQHHRQQASAFWEKHGGKQAQIALLLGQAPLGRPAAS